MSRLNEALARNPILATALNPVIGYERAAAIAKRAYGEGDRCSKSHWKCRSGADELQRLLDPAALTRGGLHGGGGQS
jgi:fumarate hydratase class II